MMRQTIDALKEFKVNPLLADDFDSIIYKLVLYLRWQNHIDKIFDMLDEIIPHLPKDTASKLLDALELDGIDKDHYLEMVKEGKDAAKDN